MSPIAHDPEAARLRRLEKEERAARDAQQRAVEDRARVFWSLSIAGGLFLAIGQWYLWHPAGGDVDGQAIANMHKLFIGQTLSIVGAVFAAAARVIRDR
jgi:hypothetical protein